jgi:hypothetical protein
MHLKCPQLCKIITDKCQDLGSGKYWRGEGFSPSGSGCEWQVCSVCSGYLQTSMTAMPAHAIFFYTRKLTLMPILTSFIGDSGIFLPSWQGILYEYC